MPRVHRHVTGSRKYADYTQETLKSACRAVKPGMSLRAAERAYGILMRTIQTRFQQFDRWIKLVKSRADRTFFRPTILDRSCVNLIGIVEKLNEHIS